MRRVEWALSWTGSHVHAWVPREWGGEEWVALCGRSTLEQQMTFCDSGNDPPGAGDVCGVCAVLQREAEPDELVTAEVVYLWREDSKAARERIRSSVPHRAASNGRLLVRRDVAERHAPARGVA